MIYNHKDPTEMDSYNYQYETGRTTYNDKVRWNRYVLILLTIVVIAAAIAEYNGINLLN